MPSHETAMRYVEGEDKNIYESDFTLTKPRPQRRTHTNGVFGLLFAASFIIPILCNWITATDLFYRFNDFQIDVWHKRERQNSKLARIFAIYSFQALFDVGLGHKLLLFSPRLAAAVGILFKTISAFNIANKSTFGSINLYILLSTCFDPLISRSFQQAAIAIAERQQRVRISVIASLLITINAFESMGPLCLYTSLLVVKEFRDKYAGNEYLGRIIYFIAVSLAIFVYIPLSRHTFRPNNEVEWGGIIQVVGCRFGHRCKILYPLRWCKLYYHSNLRSFN